MARQLFGTDGVRGTANIPPMTAAMALHLGLAAGRQFIRGDHRHLVVIGKDTRLSGYMFEPALTAGFIAMGMDVTLVGPVPTPALAMLTRSLRADLGVMISASHNPYQDNGIKLFGPDGYKLSDQIEQAIEERMRQDPDADLAAPERLGRAERLDSARGRYIEWVKASFPRDLSLSGLKIVVDCAHGAAYAVAPKVLWELGADVVTIGVRPDGCNINAGCGSTQPEAMRRAVLDHNADLGIALDGDADRVVLADERAELIDGDQVLAVIAANWRAHGRLAGNAVVATQMSNFALERHLAEQGIRLHRSKVGDRYVVERMRELGLNLGGEQSGHIVLTDFGTTGDGLVAALQVLAVFLRQNRPLSEFGRPFSPLPQSIRNVRLNGGRPLEHPEVQRAIAAAEARLNGGGRLLVRPSGTEPVVRVMVEAEDEVMLGHVLAEIGGTIERFA